MINESIKLRGDLDVVVFDKSGSIKEQRQIKNLVVDAGLNLICSRLKDGTDNAVSHIALGSGTTAAAAGDTDIESIIGSRVTLTSASVTGSAITFVSAFDAGIATGAITEAGLFNAASAGSMLCRTVFAVVNKGAQDSMSITWTITLSAS